MSRLFFCALITLLIGCARQSAVDAQWHHVQGMAWGVTPYNIKYSMAQGADTAVIGDSIAAVMARVEASASVFCPTSLVCRINASAEPMTADSLLLSLVAISKEACQASHGAFDPTLGPLIDLWGFGPHKQADGAIPDSMLIADAMQRVGIMRCTVDSAGRLHKPHPQTQFNFSAVAKGAAVDAIAAMLASQGCRNYMVEIGGELAVAGNNPNGQPWHVQIDSPDAPLEHAAYRVIAVADCAVATSGNYRNRRYDAHGNQRGHTISPATGRPIATDVASVTVIAPTCAWADALATAAMAMPQHAQALAMLDSLPRVEALIITDQGTPLTTKGFPQ